MWDVRERPTVSRMKNALTQRLGHLSKWNAGQTFGVPYTFAPNLTIAEALVAVVVAVGRIFVGSINFAAWGVTAWITYGAIHNPILRILAVLPIAILFVASTAAFMIGITAVVNWTRRKLSPSI
jgi:hypothetical protein